MSQDDNKNQSPVLKIAWQHYAEFDDNAKRALKRHLWLRGAVIILGVIATFLAVLTDTFAGEAQLGLILDRTLKILLILVPIIGATVLAFANKFQQGERWLVLRSGAEEILKEIYLYRTIFQMDEDRRQWLSERIAAIQRHVFDAVEDNLVLTPYTGKIPPYYHSDDKNSDPGFANLLADDYLCYRLESQIQWHVNKSRELETRRTWLQIGIFAFGGLGTFIAALANIQGLGGLAVWVALTTSLGAALTSWMELRRIDSTITNYSRLVLELNIIKEHWLALNKDERTGDEFIKLVTATEKVMWSQHGQYIAEMRKAVAELQGENGDKLASAIAAPAAQAIDEAIQQEAQATETVTPVEIEDTSPEVVEEEAVADEPVSALVVEVEPEQDVLEDKPKKGLPHAFVVMPFGQKQGPDGRWIDFNAIYEQLIKPALVAAGFEPFRADEEQVAGDILTDMFQELLLADLVIADLSIDNANVFYELGVRHAMRKRGVIHIQSGRAYMPFDIFNVRTIPYTCDKNGKPDPKHLEKEKQTIAQITRETWASDRSRIHSPIFNLLDGLIEPDRKTLQTPLATGYWREHKEWETMIDIAKRQKRVGDILLLIEEVRNPLMVEEAIAEAAQALGNMGQHALALDLYQRGLEINPDNIAFRREEAFHLGRLNRTDDAIVRLERLTEDKLADPETIAFIGRLYKDLWLNDWKEMEGEDERTRLKAAYNASELLKRAINTYLAAFSLDQNHYYSGINAVTLSLLLNHLAQRANESDDSDPELVTNRKRLSMLIGAVQFSIEQAAEKDNTDFWAFASLADMVVNTSEDPRQVTRAYRKALAMGGRSKGNILSTLNQLKFLHSLAFRPENVGAGLAVLEDALEKLEQGGHVDVDASEHDHDPPQIFLFAGHMIDAKNRTEPRFPAGMEAEAGQKIDEVLTNYQADTNDLAITPGIARQCSEAD